MLYFLLRFQLVQEYQKLYELKASFGNIKQTLQLNLFSMKIKESTSNFTMFKLKDKQLKDSNFDIGQIDQAIHFH